MQVFIYMENTVLVTEVLVTQCYSEMCSTMLFLSSYVSVVLCCCFRFSFVKVGNLICQDWVLFSRYLIWVWIEQNSTVFSFLLRWNFQETLIPGGKLLFVWKGEIRSLLWGMREVLLESIYFHFLANPFQSGKTQSLLLDSSKPVSEGRTCWAAWEPCFTLTWDLHGSSRPFIC